MNKAVKNENKMKTRVLDKYIHPAHMLCPVTDPGFWKGEGASAQLICSPAHLNDLVSGRLFTEPGRRRTALS